MDTETELEYIKNLRISMPKIYSFDEVRELVLFAEKKLLEKLKTELQYTTKDEETLERIRNILKIYG